MQNARDAGYERSMVWIRGGHNVPLGDDNVHFEGGRVGGRKSENGCRLVAFRAG